jgi:hypothetical protein
MPYIGKSPSAGVRQRYQYTATAGQTTFSGTDLGNLTLTYTDNNFVDVFQNGVLLKGGGTDYTATSGTSIVLTTGASVSDVIEIIVYDVFSVGNFFNRTDSDSRYALNEGGVVFNETSADVDFRVESNGNANMLFVDGGNDRVNVGHNASVAGKFNVSEAGAQGLEVVLTDADDIDLLFYNRATSAYVKANYNAEQHIFSGHGNQTSNNSLVIDSIGAMTNAAQPAFGAKKSGTQANIPVYVETKVDFETEIFDQNGDYNNSTSTFTAPVTGRYQLNAHLFMQAINQNYVYAYMLIKTSNRNHAIEIEPTAFDSDAAFSMTLCHLCDMDAGDTATVKIQFPNTGSAQTDIHEYSEFSGYLVC